MEKSRRVILKTENLSKRFGRIQAVRDLNLEVYQGDIYGFLGLNGAGKTTTIRMMLNLIRPSAGKVWLYEKELRQNYLEIMQHIGALVEIPAFYPYLSGRENLSLLARMQGRIDKNLISRLLEEVGLAERADDKVRTYSQGMRQRLGIAQALLSPYGRIASVRAQSEIRNSPLVILDEPTNGLDPQGITEVRNLIKRLSREESITFFISSHLLSEIELICNRVGIIKQGNLVSQGEVSELLKEVVGAVRLKVRPVGQAVEIIKKLDWCKEIEKMTEGDLVLKCPAGKIPELNALLVRNNIEVLELAPRRTSLEEYFISVI